MTKRPIKYRAWDTATRSMCHVWSIAWKAWDGGNALNFVQIELPDGGGTVERFEHEVELMELTGLHDKNGKEVFEGDLVIPKDAAGNKWSRPERVYWDEGTASFRISSWLAWELAADSEVVGSVFEKPELLKP